MVWYFPSSNGVSGSAAPLEIMDTIATFYDLLPSNNLPKTIQNLGIPRVS